MQGPFCMTTFRPDCSKRAGKPLPPVVHVRVRTMFDAVLRMPLAAHTNAVARGNHWVLGLLSVLGCIGGCLAGGAQRSMAHGKPQPRRTGQSGYTVAHSPCSFKRFLLNG